MNGDFGISSRIEARAQVEQQLRVEAGADLAGKHEVLAFVVADEQRAEADARALRIGKAADDELLRRLALHLQPVLRAAMLVRRAAAFRDHAFPAFAPRAFPRLVVVERDRRVAAARANVSVLSSARRSSSGSASCSPSSHRMSKT